MFRKYKAKYLILIFLSLIFYLSSLLNCTSPTKTETVTFSGTVTLADTTDYSGVEVMLFKPIDLSGEGRMPAADTALINLNKNYPGVGIELNQRTEFYWREHEPAYRTTTDAQGRWKIEDVEPGTYHIVVKKEGYGWRVLYDRNENSENTVTLKKAITWQGTYNQPVSIKENSFVQVKGTVSFKNALSVGPGTIIEFMNHEENQTNIDLNIEGEVNLRGTEGSPIYILADDSANADNIDISTGHRVFVERCVMRHVKNGFYIKQTPLVHISKNRFAAMGVALTVTQCDSLTIERNFLSDFGESAIKTFDSHTIMTCNFIINCSQVGYKAKDQITSKIKYNVYKNNGEYACAINLGGLIYRMGTISIIYNDFINNKSHIFENNIEKMKVNLNNFFKANGYYVRTIPTGIMDTLDFTHNYWNSTNVNRINSEIYDVNDVDDAKSKGPVVDFSDFKVEPIVWTKNLPY